MSMTNGSSKPIIFLAFANDRDDRVRDRYLRNLPEEARRLQQALEAAEREDLCEVVVKQNATIDDYRNGSPPLRAAINDAAWLTEDLEQRYSYSATLLVEALHS
jgi:hypothetical protein